MKVEVTVTHDSDMDCDGYFELTVDDKKEFGVGNQLSECPEDALLFRDLNFVYGIPELMKRAYDAGVRGEGFELIQREEE